MNGATPSIPWSPAMRSSAKSPASALTSRSSRWATSPPSAAWSIAVASAPPALQARSSNCERHGVVYTYNSKDKQGNITFGGYANHIVLDEAFALHVPSNLDPAAAAPLLCAGITTYSPLKHWNAGPGKKVGVVGLGGLGHMALKFSHAFGAETVLFTTSANKIEDAKKLGADTVTLTREEGWAAKGAGNLRPCHRLRLRRSRRQPLPQPAQARRSSLSRRCPRRSRTHQRLLHSWPQDLHRLHDRRHPPNPGDARLLRRAQHRLGHRDDQL